MTHLGKREPDIQTVLTNNNVLASGQVIKFSEGIAISGIENATLGPALAVIDPDTGEEKIWLYANGDISFGANDDRTGFRENAGSQVDAYHKSQRVFYYNSTGINLGEKRVDGNRNRVLLKTADFEVNSQDTSILHTNSGATGTVIFTLPQLTAGGHYYTFVRTADFTVRIVPTSEAILAPTGLLPIGNYIELANQGASVTLMADVGGMWMTIAQNGTVTPQ